MTRMKLRLINLAVVAPFAPMRRLDLDVFFRRGLDPIISVFAAREHQRVNSLLVNHTDLEVYAGRRN